MFGDNALWPFAVYSFETQLVGFSGRWIVLAKYSTYVGCCSTFNVMMIIYSGIVWNSARIRTV
jgi:hypothetical protein